MRELFQISCVPRSPEFELVGTSGDGNEAVFGINHTHPDFVILDLELPSLNGFEVIAAVQQKLTSTKFIVYSGHCSDWTVYLAQQFKVAGYLDKPGNGIEAVFEAVRKIDSGGTFFSTRYQHHAWHLQQSQRGIFSHVLSNRELDLLPHFADAKTDEEIACATGLAESTVSSHRCHIMRKLGVASTPKLMKYALDSGFSLLRSPAEEADPLMAMMQ